MGQKAEINGTGYDLKAGKCLVGGTAYAIKKGRTLIGGTGSDIILGPQISKTWYFNAVIDATEYQGLHDEQIRFVSNGSTFDTIRFGYMMSMNGIAYLNSGTITTAYYGAWQDQGFRTVMFEEAPSGTLLEFLIKNAVEK